MPIGLENLYDNQLGAGTNTPPITNPIGAQQPQTDYSGFKWNQYDLNNYQGMGLESLGDYFKSAGYTGNLYDQSVLKGAGVNNEDITQNNVSQGLKDWLSSNNYTLAESRGADAGAQKGTAYDALFNNQGQMVGSPVSRSFDDSTGWFEQAVPLIIGAMMGGAGNIAMGGGATAGASVGGTGNGAFLGEGVASGIPAWDAAAGGAASGFGSGLPSIFNAAQDSQLANTGGADVWGNAGNGMTGATVATNTPSAVDLGSLGGVMATTGGGGALAGAGTSAAGGNTVATVPGGAKTIGDILKGVGGNLASNLTSPNGLAGLLGLWNANNQKSNWQSQMDELNKNFATDSPYAQQMAETLARKDSAAGRNSQYGPRSVELAAKLAEAKANSVKDLITMQNQENMAQNSGIRDLATIFGGGDNSIFSGLSTGFQDLLKLLQDGS